MSELPITTENRHLTRFAREHLKDPNISLVETLSETGFEGLTDEQRLEVIEAASLQDYITTIDLIHRKVAPDSSAEIHSDTVRMTNPKTGEVNAITARPEDRKEIMEHALRNAKLVAEKYRLEGGSLEDALMRCSNLAAFGVVLAHNYLDGNGRTARTIGQLIGNGFKASDRESLEDLEAVSSNRPEKGYRIFSYVPKNEWQFTTQQDPEKFLEFLDVVAAIEQPLDDISYRTAVSGKFTTPFMA